MFGATYDWNNLVRRARNTWPAVGTSPLAQFVDTDSVSGFSWQEVRANRGLWAEMFQSRVNGIVLPTTQKQVNYLEELTGFFIPPVDGNYSFYIRADDGSAFFLSTDSNPANLKLVAQSTSAQPDASFASFFFYGGGPGWGLGNAGQISAPIPLRAGSPYFTRVLHMQGIGGDFLDAAMRISTAASNFSSEAQRSLRSSPTVLMVRTTCTVVREVQVCAAYLGQRALLLCFAAFNSPPCLQVITLTGFSNATVWDMYVPYFGGGNIWSYTGFPSAALLQSNLNPIVRMGSQGRWCAATTDNIPGPTPFSLSLSPG